MFYIVILIIAFYASCQFVSKIIEEKTEQTDLRTFYINLGIACLITFFALLNLSILSVILSVFLYIRLYKV